MKNLLSGALVLFSLTLYGGESNFIRVETRMGFGGRIATGKEKIGSVDGTDVHEIDTAVMEDAWTTFSSDGATSSLCVLNDPAVEGGRLDADMTWDSARVHVVRDNVVVPDGVTLTLPCDCVVKFTAGARIYVESGGRIAAKGAILADIADDTISGDTNLDSGSSEPSGADWWNDDAVIGALYRETSPSGVERVYSLRPITFNIEGGVLVGYDGEMPNGYELIIPDGVTAVAPRAFAGCEELQSVIIPSSVTSIGAAVFSGCSGLKTVVVSRKDYDLSVFPEGCRIVYAGDIDISNIRVFSGWPWKDVVIGYTITGSSAETMSLELTAKENVSGKTYVCKTLEGVDLAPGSHVIKWNASADDAKFKSDNVVFTARVIPPPLYYVIDLSGGTSAASYPVTGLANMPDGGWSDEYKTTKLVLRRVEAGTFKMGDAERDGQMYDITLTKPFYMGVFEVTQKQWELVMGTRPSYFNHDDYYASRPVEQVSYDMIRGSSVGAGWPANNAVDATSFLGKLRTKTGLDFDLPTAAQWECACRAGTTTDYNNGTNRSGFEQDANMAVVGRYAYNSGYSRHSYVQSSAPSAGTAVVGSYVPNAWGLYDMHGNVWEWCLDWLDWGGLYTATDPKGVSSGSCRVLRGGSWFDVAGLCDSYDQLDFTPSDDSYGVGFRLSRTLQEQETDSLVNTSGSAVALAEASSASTAVDTTFADGAAVAGPLSVTYGSVGSSGCRVTANNTEIVNSTASGTKEWMPPTGGEYQLVYFCGGVTMESTVIAEELTISSPVITPCDGSVFRTGTCAVTINCATEGSEIYYTTNGRTPRVAETNRYKEPFLISDTATIVAVAVKGEKLSEYVEATITKVIPEPLTLVGVLDEPKLADVTTGGDAEWLPIEDATAKVGGSCAVSGALDDNGEEESTWLEAKVYGKGTLAFWWRVSCEPDPRSGKFTYDFAAFAADDEVVVQKDGESDWVQVTKTFTTDGEHVIRWSYNTDGYPSDDYDGCVWVDGVMWSGSAAPEEPSKPIIEGDEGATVTGNAETGFVVKPSEGKTAVEVTIPQGVDAGKVTVEVSTKVASVKPNGAKVKIVSGGADITEYLNIPGTTRGDDGGVVATQSDGVIDLTKATVKEEYVKETLDVEKGAVIDLCGGSQGAASPTITTAPTRVGLFYQLREGETLGGMKDGDSKVGDGEPWSPKITVKGDKSAFYSIGVGKGE